MKVKINQIDLTNSYEYHAWNATISEHILIKDAKSFFQKNDATQYRTLTKAVYGKLGKKANYKNLTFSPSSFSEQTDWIII